MAPHYRGNYLHLQLMEFLKNQHDKFLMFLFCSLCVFVFILYNIFVFYSSFQVRFLLWCAREIVGETLCEIPGHHVGNYLHWMYWRLRDQFVYAHNQWEAMLQCNAIAHCLSAYTKWSLMGDGLLIVDTAWYHYNVNFLENLHNRHPIADQWRWALGILLWVHNLISIMPESLQCCVEYLVIMDQVRTAPGSILLIMQWAAWFLLTHWGWDKMADIFADNSFKCIFLNENVWISITTSLMFVLNGPISNIPTLVQIMAWCRPGNKPLSEPIMGSLLDAYMHHSASMS